MIAQETLFIKYAVSRQWLLSSVNDRSSPFAPTNCIKSFWLLKTKNEHHDSSTSYTTWLFSYI